MTIDFNKTRHINITGMTFGYLTAIVPVGFTTQQRLTWKCVCKCGNHCIRSAPQLRKKGSTPSCGCKFREKRGGKRDFKSYQVWRSMIQRCRDKDYPNYGERGIKVCKRWLIFENFFEDMGEKPDGMSIDRIDNNGNYEPSNCRWATSKQQTRNYRRNHFITYKGKTMCIKEWSEKLGIDARLVYGRLSKGWGPISSLTTPISIHHPRKGTIIDRSK